MSMQRWKMLGSCAHIPSHILKKKLADGALLHVSNGKVKYFEIQTHDFAWLIGCWLSVTYQPLCRVIWWKGVPWRDIYRIFPVGWHFSSFAGFSHLLPYMKNLFCAGKAALITVAGLVVGAGLGGWVESWLRVDIVPVLGIGSPTVVVSEFVLFSLWASSLYLRWHKLQVYNQQQFLHGVKEPYFCCSFFSCHWGTKVLTETWGN